MNAVRVTRCGFCLMLLVSMVGMAHAEGLEWIEVASEGKGFVGADSGQPFKPWGFNYDHDETGRLIEDYWHDEWAKVEADFGEMKQLGANVVRIHLQTGKFLDAPDKPNERSLERLSQLLKLAERTGLYLDLTGLGCYHKADVPVWFDALSRDDRWKAQAVFWEAVAERCADSPAVFCYDLMNEPVVAGGKGRAADWLGPPLGNKHFVQYIALENGGRPRPEIAKEWIQKLVPAIRRVDKRHLITVGLVPWSLDRPGLTSGFVPSEIVNDLDFMAVHLYPEKGKLDDALETLKGFNVGKPVVVEETFTLKCSTEELEQVMDRSDDLAAGWIGFYWGRTPEEYRDGKTIAEAITRNWLVWFQERGKK